MGNKDVRKNVECKLSVNLPEAQHPVRIVSQSLDLLCKDKTLFYPRVALFYGWGGRDCLKPERNLSCTHRAGAGSVFYCITWSKEAKEMAKGGVVWNLWN